MSLLSLFTGHEDTSHPTAVPWHRDARGHFVRLLRLRANTGGLDGLGGVYLLWHRGLRPGWIAVGCCDDLGETLQRLRDAEPVLDFETRGGVYATWAPIKPEYRDGVANYLRDTLHPAITENLDSGRDLRASPVPVIPPQ